MKLKWLPFTITHRQAEKTVTEQTGLASGHSGAQQLLVRTGSDLRSGQLSRGRPRLDCGRVREGGGGGEGGGEDCRDVRSHLPTTVVTCTRAGVHRKGPSTRFWFLCDDFFICWQHLGNEKDPPVANRPSHQRFWIFDFMVFSCSPFWHLLLLHPEEKWILSLNTVWVEMIIPRWWLWQFSNYKWQINKINWLQIKITK